MKLFKIYYMLCRNLWLYVESLFGLSFQLAKAEFKLKNEGSYLGILWYLLNPLLTFALLFLIFSNRLGTTIPLYPLYLLLGIVMFNLFQSTTLESTKAILHEHSRLIKSINFKRESLIISIALKNLFSHFFEVLLFLCLLILLGNGFIWIVWYIPILFFFMLFIISASLFLSSLTVFFVDLDNVWNFAVRLIWFGTPLFYTIDSQTWLSNLNALNPLYYFISMTRDIVIYHITPDLSLIWGVLGFSLASILLGLLVFKKLNRKIAELV